MATYSSRAASRRSSIAVAKKFPAWEVEKVVMEHPAVAEVAAFAMPHAQLGEDIAIAIVLHQNASATAKEIRAFAATRLADFKVPRQVLFVDEIPKGTTGKVQRIGLAEDWPPGTWSGAA